MMPIDPNDLAAAQGALGAMPQGGGGLSPGALNGGAAPQMPVGGPPPTPGAPGAAPDGNVAKAALQGAASGMGSGGGSGAGNGLLSGVIKSGVQAGLSALAASDERLKTGIKAGGPPVRNFMDALKAHEYRYTHPQAAGAGRGRFVSPMAQELEKAGPVGKSMVADTPQGKMVDYRRGLGAMLAAQADLHHRVKKLEG